MEQEAVEMTIQVQAMWAAFGFLTFWIWAGAGIMTYAFRARAGSFD